MTTDSNEAAALRMDGIYRLQRHVYDATRKFYLLGRDRLLQRLPRLAQPDILEVGCGTGRNLIKLARRYPKARLCGVDVSQQMLTTAGASVARAGVADRIRLERVGGDIAAGGRVRHFDIVLLSYVLSMIPQWEIVVDQAIQCLKPGGVLAVVDFKEQHGRSPWGRLLSRWLALFHVYPRDEIAIGLRMRAEAEAGLLLDEDVGGGYAYLFMLRRAFR